MEGDHLLKVKTNKRTRTVSCPWCPYGRRVPSCWQMTRASCRRLSPSAPFLCPAGTFGVRGRPRVNFCLPLFSAEPLARVWECAPFTKEFRMMEHLAAPTQGTCGHCGDIDSLGDPPEPLPHPVCTGSWGWRHQTLHHRVDPMGVLFPAGQTPSPRFCP